MGCTVGAIFPLSTLTATGGIQRSTSFLWDGSPFRGPVQNLCQWALRTWGRTVRPCGGLEDGGDTCLA